jgi:hypothetical protein
LNDCFSVSTSGDLIAKNFDDIGGVDGFWRCVFYDRCPERAHYRAGDGADDSFRNQGRA